MAKTIIHFLALFLCYSNLFDLTRSSAAQVPISSDPHEGPDNSNLIFASLHSLLKSWPQAFSPHGHAVLPVTVKTGTLLYHAGDATETPTGMHWFSYVLLCGLCTNCDKNYRVADLMLNIATYLGEG
jgi:hypothetical protein